MQPTTPIIPVPKIDSDVPVAVIPTASVAPLDGPPDGERINTFTLAPKKRDGMLQGSAADALGLVRDRARSQPLACMAAAFSLGFVLARLLR